MQKTGSPFHIPAIGIIFGALSGFALAGFRGFFLGFILGACCEWLIVGLRPDRKFLEGLEGIFWSRMSFLSNYPEEIIVVAAKLSKIDGPINENEIRAFKTSFGVLPQEVKTLAKIYRKAGQTSSGFESAARKIRDFFMGSPAKLELILDKFFIVAESDGPLTDKEIRFLREVSFWFGFNPATWERISRRYLPREETRSYSQNNYGKSADFKAPSPLFNHYQVLGLKPGADQEAIKAAYKKLMRTYHPDRFADKDLSEADLKSINTKVAEINAAYSELKKLW